MAHPQPVQSEPETEETAAFVEAVQEGIEAADAGRTVPFEEVRRWVLSWGTPEELPPPVVARRP